MSTTVQGPSRVVFPLGIDWQGLVGARAVAVSVISGALFSLAFPGFDQAWLAWIALVPVWALLLTRTRRRETFAIALSMGIGFFGGLDHWLLAMHPLTWLGLTEMASLAVVFVAWALLTAILSAGCAIVIGMMGVAFLALRRQGKLEGRSVLPLTFAAWSALELFQAYNPFGYTWGMVATTQYRVLPVLQGLRWVGPFPLGALIVAFNAGLAWAWVSGRKRSAVVMAVLGSSWACAGSLGAFGEVSGATVGLPIRVSVVQGAVSQTEKWSPGNEWRILERYEALTRSASPSDLVVWPESALPVALLQTPAMRNRLSDLARERGAGLITGTFVVERDPLTGRSRYYNATVGVGPDGRLLGWDAKKHLVPFGEFLPWRHVLPSWWSGFFGGMNLLGEDLTPGDRPRPYPMPWGSVGTNVCFDSIFPDVMRSTAAARADLLVLVTNDGWYKRTMALQQHLAQGVLRAVETGRPFVQAANTGASALVEPSGRIVAEAPWDEAIALTGQVSRGTGRTPYVRHGDGPAIGLMLLAFGMSVWPRRRRDA